MKLLEYEAKQQLQQYGVPIPKALLIHMGNDITQIPLPTVVKSQVPVGGRGKAGGIRIVQTPAELDEAIRTIGTLPIKGYTPVALLCEEVLHIGREFYVSLVINRSESSVELVAHHQGGIEVESNESSHYYRRILTPATIEGVGDSLADYLNLPEQSFALQDTIGNLYTCMVRTDATLIEVNPLVYTTQGVLVAGDCKMELDDAAAFRHNEWSFVDTITDTNFVTLDPMGTVATIANGAGLAMATVDAVKAAGLTPANFLDIGGGATTEKIVQSFSHIMNFTNVNAIVINIFGGIVRCDTVAHAIIDASAQLPNLPNLYIRLSGNRSTEAAELLEEHGLWLCSSLDECVKELTDGQ